MVVAAFILAVATTGLFAFRVVRQARHLHPRMDEPIRPWMSVYYIAHSYRVPPYVLFQAIHMPPRPHDRRPIKEIAREQGRPVNALIAELQNAIIHARPPYPPPSPLPAPEHGGSP